MMEIAVYAGMAITLTLVAWQDFKWRRISLPLILVVAGLVLANGLLRNQFSWQQFLGNTLFVGLQLIFLMVYLVLRGHRLRNFFNAYLGLGDVVFMLVCAMYVSFPFFILFLLGTYLLAVLVEGAKRLLNRVTVSSVPLAGFMALSLLLLLSMHQFNLASPEDWLWNWLMNR